MVLTIPWATVDRVVGQLLEKGRIAHGYLGVGMQPVRLPEALKRTLNLPGAGGVIIVAVEPESPAERAGLLIGDVVVALDGVPVSDTADVQSVLGPEDLALAEAAVPGGVAAIEDAIGLEAKVALYPGRPILASQLRAPALVERNALVRMSYAKGALRIVTDGRTLDRAAAGEPVRVMNLASKQTVTGVVAADGTIEVGQ